MNAVGDGTMRGSGPAPTRQPVPVPVRQPGARPVGARPAGASVIPAEAPVDLVRAVEQSGALRLGARLLIAAPLVAIAGGRWGTYIGLEPLFLTDLLVALGLALLAFDRAANGAEVRLPRAPGVVRAASVIMAAVALMGLVRGGIPDLFAVRDALPFIYLAMAPAFVLAVRVIGLSKVLRAVLWTSVFHTLWYAAAVFGVLPEITLPLVGIPAFTARGDFDGFVCGVAIAAVMVVSRAPLPWRLLIVALAVGGQLAQGSRAGLVSMLIVVGAVALATRPFRDERLGPLRLAAVFVALPAAAGALMVATQSSGWWRGLERLIAGTVDTEASNTTSARIDAWNQIGDYVARSTQSEAFGLGFGSNFVQASGAVAHLSGSTSVRQAHSFIVGWYALVGAVGLTAVLIAFAMLVGHAVRRMRRDPGARFGAAMQLGLLFAAAVGVILESPFGYLSYLLAVGLASGTRPVAPVPDAPDRQAEVSHG